MMASDPALARNASAMLAEARRIAAALERMAAAAESEVRTKQFLNDLIAPGAADEDTSPGGQLQREGMRRG